MTRTWWHTWPGPTWKTCGVSQLEHHRISFLYGKIPAGLRTPQAASTLFSPNSQIYNILYDTQQWWLTLLDCNQVFNATLTLSLAHYFLWITKKRKKKALKTFRHVKALPQAGRHHYMLQGASVKKPPNKPPPSPSKDIRQASASTCGQL